MNHLMHKTVIKKTFFSSCVQIIHTSSCR